ncbi:hypothetical protein [Ghiorsea bivora]|uniref:hypothetical protein n=1 Tax=Ghiorsea bivora TaxID=1485545 RepID=UPI00068B1D38|nr:hypothetical protein [Ghiorsea bivora]
MGKKMFWLLMVAVVVFGVLAATRSIWQDPAEQTWMKSVIPKVNILPKEKSEAYAQACASCHMLYAPSMLPARSWKQMMLELDNHFGDNAELESSVREEVSAYLQRNAADKVENIYAQPMLNLLKDDETPQRISDTAYFKLVHDIVRPEMVSGNPDVKSVARCEICHYEAMDGRFSRFSVRIPNYYKEGTWHKVREKSSESGKAVQQ